MYLDTYALRTQLRDDSYERAARRTVHYAVALAWLL